MLDLPAPYGQGSLLDIWRLAGGDSAALVALLRRVLRETPSRIPYATLDVQPAADRAHLLQPIEAAEIWAAGVTYERSLEARIAETTAKDVYDRVYEAERPEVFFKATASRCVGPNAALRIRADSQWTVPEPEVGLVLDASGTIVGYTLGNDMSARDIEGANPLYLPQAKIYDGCCSVGPAILVTPTPGRLVVSCRIVRGGSEVYSGATTTERMRRAFEELVAYLGRDNTYPPGTVLLTGTGIVPPDDVTLEDGDIVEIASPAIGVLRNVATRTRPRVPP